MTKVSTEQFLALRIAVLTVSDTRTEANDSSGKTLVDGLTAAGHVLAEKRILPDNIYKIRAVVSKWIADDDVQIVLTTGGTGLTGRDSTPEAIKPLLDKEIEGFGEMFRVISFAEIKASTLQSRALAGVANGTYVFCLPGSTNACKTGWDQLLRPQLDSRTRPCNFAELFVRLRES
jgi:molybdopterin adenylyltransferase